MLTDRPVANNRPDIVLIEKEEKHSYIIDLTIPSDDRAYSEKITKYSDLSFEMKEIPQLWSAMSWLSHFLSPSMTP